MMTLDEFLSRAWTGYARLTPDAPRIHSWLAARGENIVNDHVALRTFDVAGMSRLELGRLFECWGYVRAPGDLDFPEKKLKATYYLHEDERYPKVFISELLLSRCSLELQRWINSLTNQARRPLESEDLLRDSENPLWKPIRFADYERFYAESEYAAWTAAFGVRVNHFTVLVNRLRTFDGLPALNDFLRGQGALLNSAGGEIKGSATELLEQSSTMARSIPWRFAEGERSAAGCYYEFALRHVDPATGRLFSGFVPKSADKIFESTFENK